MRRVRKTISVLPSVWSEVEKRAGDDYSASRLVEIALRSLYSPDEGKPRKRKARAVANCD